MIEYLPYKRYKYLCIFFILAIILEIGCIVEYMNSIVEIFFMLCVSVFGVILCYRLSKLKLMFTEEAVHIKHFGQQEYKVYYYEDYLYAFYGRNHKAGLHLVLSKRWLKFERLKRVINRASIFEKTFVENCVVIFLDESEITDQIKNLVRKSNLTVIDKW